MLKDIFINIIYIYNESALYILFGFLIAGLIKTVIAPERIFHYLGRKNLRSVVIASLMGVPLPLCSCAVLPTAISLRKQGASRGATLSFLISTPETGIDSISITYALIDPLMTVFRPVSALVTSLSAGLIANQIDHGDAPDGPVESEMSGACNEHCACEVTRPDKGGRVRQLLHYAFVDLLNDIVFWLIIGIVIAGVISAIVPDNFFEKSLSEFSSFVVMLAFGVPIYMCAASSTPIAAALIMKGLTPGAALVFLLAGPATNVGTIAAVGRFLGKKMMAVYLLTIAAASVCLGVILNRLYSFMGMNPAAVVGQASELVPSSLKVFGSITLTFFIIRNLRNTGLDGVLHSLDEKLYDFSGFRIRHRGK